MWGSSSRCKQIDTAIWSERWRWRASACHCDAAAWTRAGSASGADSRLAPSGSPSVPSSEEEDRPLRWDEKPDGTHEYWLDENWQATPLPAPPMEPKLIPIVTTAAEADAVELVQTYTRRWPAQENVIRDCAPFRCEIGYLPKAGEVESETSRTTPDLTRKLGKGH